MLLMLFVPSVAGGPTPDPPLPGPPAGLPPIADVTRANFSGTRDITAPWDYPPMRGLVIRGRRLN